MATKKTKTEHTSESAPRFKYGRHVLVENKRAATHTASLPSGVQTDANGSPVLVKNPQTGKDVPVFTPARSIDLLPGVSPVRIDLFEELGGIEGITKRAHLGPVFDLIAESADLSELEPEATREELIDVVSKTNHIGLLEAWQDDTRIRSGQIRTAIAQKLLMLKNPDEFLRQHPERKDALLNMAVL